MTAKQGKLIFFWGACFGSCLSLAIMAGAVAFGYGDIMASALTAAHKDDRVQCHCEVTALTLEQENELLREKLRLLMELTAARAASSSVPSKCGGE